jgi:SAM-dependent methyltransferase
MKNGTKETEYPSCYLKKKQEPERVLIDFCGEIKKKSKILDVGCGFGTEGVFLAKEGHDVVCVDNDKEVILQAIENSKRDKVNIKFFCENFFEFVKNIGNNSFDCVLDCGFSHCLRKKDRNRFYKECWRILTSDGRYLAQVFSDKDIKCIENFSKRKWTFRYWDSNKKIYCYHFTKEKLINSLKRNKFKIIKYKIVDIARPTAIRKYHAIVAKKVI